MNSRALNRAKEKKMNGADIISGMFMAVLMVIILIVAYTVLAMVSAKAEWKTFYGQLKPNRWAFVVKNGDIDRVIYNSGDFKLVDEPGFPYGKFVERRILTKQADGSILDEGEDPRPDLQKLDWFESLFGLRFIGFPFVHSLLGKRLSWINVDDVTKFKEEEKVVWDFAITKTFGFKLNDLTLGTDKDDPKRGTEPPATADKNSDPDDRKLQRILVNIKMLAQVVLRDPYKAIVTRIWNSGSVAKMSPCVQTVLGTMSQDELIQLKRGAGGNGSNQIVEAVLANLAEIQVFGADFVPDTITYIDYELAGTDDDKKSIQTANTNRFVKKQEAAGIREVKKAEQTDLSTQKDILLETLAGIKTNYPNMPEESAATLAMSLIRAKALTSTNLTTYVEGGGASVGLNINSDGKKGRG